MSNKLCIRGMKYNTHCLISSPVSSPPGTLTTSIAFMSLTPTSKAEVVDGVPAAA